MKRLDLLLVDKGLASSRTKAQDLIHAGVVEVQSLGVWKKCEKPSQEFDEETPFRTLENNVEKYVSRGGLKLEGALLQFDLDIRGFRVLDIGQSTGGFTDCLLKKGAAKIVGIEVGHDQLHENLKGHPQILTFEGLHVKDLAQSCGFLESLPSGGFELAVMDVSFISLKQVIPFVTEFLKPRGEIVALVKPQFEVGSENLGKDGVVKDPKVIQSLRAVFQSFIESQGFEFLNYVPSVIAGKDGNQEFFLYAKKMASPQSSVS